MAKSALLLGTLLVNLSLTNALHAEAPALPTADQAEATLTTTATVIETKLKAKTTALVVSGSNATLVAQSARKLAIISESCKASERKCLNTLERYFRENQEHSASSKILGLFDSLNFWGAAQETHYTEIELPIKAGDTADIIEYQIGVGYQMAARQSAAKMKAQGLLASLPFEITGNSGGTRYWAMLIGLAPDKLGKDNAAPKDSPYPDQLRQTCDNAKDDNPAGALLCTFDMQPAVTQRYFRDTSARMAEALDRLRRDYRKQKGSRADGSTLSQVCPQVIDFRYRDPRMMRTIAPENVTEAMQIGALAINDILSEICANKRPNAKIVYRDGTALEQWEKMIRKQFRGDREESSGTPSKRAADDAARNIAGSAAVGLGDGGVSAAKKRIGQDYDRSHNYLALSSKTAPVFLAPEYDRGLIITMEGLTKSVKVPSILTSIVSYQRDDLSQYLSVKLKCGGGSAEVAGSENPVANAVAYAGLLDGLRMAIDASTAPTTDGNDMFDTRCKVGKVNAEYDGLYRERVKAETATGTTTQTGNTGEAATTETRN